MARREVQGRSLPERSARAVEGLRGEGRELKRAPSGALEVSCGGVGRSKALSPHGSRHSEDNVLTEPAKAKTPASSPGDAGGEREIDEIYSAPEVHWVGDGFRVAGYFSSIPDAARRLSPFLLLDYHLPYTYPPTRGKRGVGPPPHRGFETVTISWAGSVAPQDSA